MIEKEITLMANSGIHLYTFSLEVNREDRYKLWYHEWEDTARKKWALEPVYELRTEEDYYYYKKKELHTNGYLGSDVEITVKDLYADGITPLAVGDTELPAGQGELFSMTFRDRQNKFFDCFENVWLPLPYFFKKTPKRFDFGPFNWARVKFVPKAGDEKVKQYDVIIAFDTRTKYEEDEYRECPCFPDSRECMDFELCGNEFFLMDYCSPDKMWSYVDEQLLKIVHPGLQDITQLKDDRQRRMGYISSYMFLMTWLAEKDVMPKIRLYKDDDVVVKDVDMVVDLGNSKTTALLVEDNSSFNQVRQLEITDLTDILRVNDEGETEIRRYCDSFDMRLAFRRADFGNFGHRDSKQFVYPSLVRLGTEASHLIHRAKAALQERDEVETLSTYSSPKRYLWDWRPSVEEWKYLVLEGENDGVVLHLPGISENLRSDGTLDKNGNGGSSYHYSRRSLMTFAFLEMLVQADRQINSDEHRSNRTGFGNVNIPRRIKRVLITCPTAMCRLEREALVNCAKEAVELHARFKGCKNKVEIVPTFKRANEKGQWYYDEATCSQLVYMYGEVGHKYKGCCSEFFELYGKRDEGAAQAEITIGSLDIGAGTSDLMISKYSYTKGEITTITPDPQFYDSYYYAGDDMLYALVKNLMILSENSAYRQALASLDTRSYRQKMKNFFGRDYNGQSVADRVLRKEFNIQYSVPVMYKFLDLLNKGAKSCYVSFEDVFGDCPPSKNVIEGFKERTGIDVRNLTWDYDREVVSDMVSKEFEPLLKKIATIMYSYACDVVLLSGRPASLAPIRSLFLKYYSVSPDRLIVLNNYYVGDWYPFGENTGHIKNAKTVVVMGGLIGHYASEINNLDRFLIDLNKLNTNLVSTVNYVYANDNLLLSEDKKQGEVTMITLPQVLSVRQVDMKSYPARALYSIDFNRHKMGDRVRSRALMEGNDIPSDARVQMEVKEIIDRLRRRMPFTVKLERNDEDSEQLQIVEILDNKGEQVQDSNLEVHVQSLGGEEEYWLDSGALDF